MQFKVGPKKTYTVRRRWDLAVDGETTKGLVVFKDEIIWLDGELSEQEMVDTLRHELSHAWEECTGGPRDTEEARAQFNATVSASFDEGFEEGGGMEGLLEIDIEGSAAAYEPRKPQVFFGQNTNRRYCGHEPCGNEMAIGEIQDNEPVELARDIYAMDRWFHCQHCGSVTTWRERCTGEGMPLGDFIQAKLLKGEKALLFIRAQTAPF